MTKYFISILTICFLNTYGQDSISYFNDFNDINESWKLLDNEYEKVNISNGNLIFSHKKETGTRWTHSSIFLNPLKDFIIEAVIKQTNGSENLGYGIVFGLNGGDDLTVLNITSSGYVSIYEYENNKFIDVLPWKKTSAIKSLNNNNKFTIKNNSGKIIYLINDEEVYKSNYKKLKGNNLGFIINKNMSIEVDYLKVLQNEPTTINLVKNLPKGFVKENLGSKINSPYIEKCPLISADGKTLYVCRQHPENTDGEKDSDIWFAELSENNEWMPLKKLGEPLNNKAHNFLISITPDNNTMLLGNLYKKNGSSGGSGFSISQRTNEGWSFPKKVEVKNYTNKSKYTSSCLSNNRKVMIISVESNFTYGERDLYVSFLQEDNTWSEPKNMGSTINTFGQEDTPFLAADDVTLYYSTDGKRGFGSNDIFLTRRLDSTWTNWSEPENMGPEINSSDWDAYYSIPASGEFAYISSKQNSIGSLDIFKIKLAKEAKPKPVVLIYGKVLNKKDNSPLQADIDYFNLATNQSIGKASSNPTDGTYKIILPAGIEYSFLASKKEFISKSEHIDVSTIDTYKEIEQNLYLTPIEVGQSIVINNVFFETAKSELLATSFPDLERVIKLLNDYPTLKIELSGHTDNVGSDEFNLKLSDARANSVMNYLIGKQIAPTRLTAKGYGKQKPIADNSTDEGKAKNRRVEFTILSK